MLPAKHKFRNHGEVPRNCGFETFFQPHETESAKTFFFDQRRFVVGSMSDTGQKMRQNFGLGNIAVTQPMHQKLQSSLRGLFWCCECDRERSARRRASGQTGVVRICFTLVVHASR